MTDAHEFLVILFDGLINFLIDGTLNKFSWSNSNGIRQFRSIDTSVVSSIQILWVDSFQATHEFKKNVFV